MQKALDALENPYKTEQVQGWDGIRKLRIGNKRLFFVIAGNTLYVLAYLSRQHCYKRKPTVVGRRRRL